MFQLQFELIFVKFYLLS